MNGSATSLVLSASLDRSLAWHEGGSVRYLVVDVSATGPAPSQAPPINLALAVDVSGSMGGDKIAAAERAALSLVDALTDRDRLSLVAFREQAELLLDTRRMNEAGRREAAAAIARLTARGGTNLFDGWLLAAERVATAMRADPAASHRVMLLSDGHTNVGTTDRLEIAGHVGSLLERGVLTAALGIGEGYDEVLLGALADAGGGSLHDAAGGSEIAEVVLGELREGRGALFDRTTLKLSIPPGVRAEVLGAWAHSVAADILTVTVGNLSSGQTKRLVVRLLCPSRPAGTSLPLAVAATAAPPAGAPVVAARDIELVLRFVRGSENNAQRRDDALSLAVVQAWTADLLRDAARMNRDGDRRPAVHYLERQLKWLMRYARGIAGTDPLVAEVALVQRRSGEAWDERARKEIYAASTKRGRHEIDRRSMPRPSIAQHFGDPQQ